MALTRITKGVIKPNENYDTHNINSTGIVTAIGLDVNGNGDISGNLSVGGVLTYEDVTSIDSVGIITAQKGIHVGAGISVVGIVTAATFKGDGDLVELDVDGHTNLDNVSIAGVSTFAENIDANGDLDVDGHTNLDNVSVAGISTFGGSTQNTVQVSHNSGYGLRVERGGRYLDLNGNWGSSGYGAVSVSHGLRFISGASSNIQFFNNTIEAVRIDGNGNVNVYKDLDVDGHTNLDNVSVAGVSTFSGNVNITNTNPKLFFYDTNNDSDYAIVNNGGVFRINDETNSLNRFSIDSNGNVSILKDLDVDGHTNLDNVNIAGVTTSGHLNINGDLTINDNYPSIYLNDTDSNSDFMLQNQNGIFTVYDATNNADRFEILSDGTVRSPHYTLQSQSPSLTFNDTNHDSDFMIQNANGLFKIFDNTNGADRFAVNSSGSVFVYGNELYIGDSIIHHGDANTKIRFPANDQFSVETNGIERLRIKSNGNVGVGSDNPQADFEVFGYSSAASGAAPILAIRNGYSGTANASNALKSELRFLHKNHNAAHEFMATRIMAETTDNYMQRTFLRFLVANANNGTERLTISPYGKVGINSTSPNATLVVQEHEDNNPSLRMYRQSTGGDIAALIWSTAAGNQAMINYRGGGGSTGMQFYTGGTSSSNLRMIINTSGKVGIGEDDPDDNHLLIRGSSTVGTNKGHIMLTGDSATVDQGPQIVFAESGATSSYAGGSIGFERKGGNSQGDLIFGTRGTSGDASTTTTERLRIASDGSVSIGNNPTVHTDTIFHVEKSSGETNVKFEGNDTMGARLSLHNNNTSASANNQLAFCDAGGQSTSTIIGYNTDQTNNYGELVFATRNAQGTPPEERLRINSDGTLKLTTPGNTQQGTFFTTFTLNNTNSNTYSRIRFDRSGVARWGLSLDTSDRFAITNLYQNGSVAANDACFIIQNTGKIGMNLFSPQAQLHIKHGNSNTDSGLMIQSDNSRYHQTFCGRVTFPSSNGWVNFIYSDHSHSIEIQYMILEDENAGYGGAHGRLSFFTTYGNSSGPVYHENRRNAMNGGGITSDPQFEYVNTGGTVSHMIRVRVSYNTNRTFRMHYMVRGFATGKMYQL